MKSILAAARFQGNLWVGVQPDGRCSSARILPYDDKVPGLSCAETRECTGNGGEIASAHWKCATYDIGDVDIFTYPHDTLKFCRAGFCSCMNTIWESESGGEPKYSKFYFNDEHAWNC